MPLNPICEAVWQPRSVYCTMKAMLLIASTGTFPSDTDEQKCCTSIALANEKCHHAVQSFPDNKPANANFEVPKARLVITKKLRVEAI